MTAPTTRETADHAELAACPFCGGEAKSETLGHGKSARTGVKCADVDCPGSMRLVGPDEDGVAFWNRRPREAALLSEIAALRGERQNIVSHATMGATDGEGLTVNAVSVEITRLRNAMHASYHARATQAERQRDELRKATETAANLFKLCTEPTMFENASTLNVYAQMTEWLVRNRPLIANQGADQ